MGPVSVVQGESVAGFGRQVRASGGAGQCPEQSTREGSVVFITLGCQRYRLRFVSPPLAVDGRDTNAICDHRERCVTLRADLDDRELRSVLAAIALRLNRRQARECRKRNGHALPHEHAPDPAGHGNGHGRGPHALPAPASPPVEPAQPTPLRARVHWLHTPRTRADRH